MSIFTKVRSYGVFVTQISIKKMSKFRCLLKLLFCRIFDKNFGVSSTFSVLRPLYFDILSNLDFLLVEKHRSKYSFGRSKEIEVKFWSK